MKHNIYHKSDGVYHMFNTERGVIWACVRLDGSDGVVSILENETIKAGATRDLSEEEIQLLPEAQKARNSFGTSIMLRVIRALIKTTPEVENFVWERKIGINAGRHYKRTF